jgi:hypothetical protein
MFKIIVALALVAQSAAVCTGKSADLPAKECAAWQDFFDALDGPNWPNFGSDGRSDPCSVKSKIGNPCKGGPSKESIAMFEERVGGPVGGDPWQEPDAGVCCLNGHITQLAFALNGLAGELVSLFPLLHFFSYKHSSACLHE